MKFYVSQTEDQFSFSLTTDSGTLLAQSKSFPSQDECIVAIRALTTALPNESAYRLSGNKFSFLLDGNSVAESTTYDTAAAAQQAMRAIIEDASDEAQYTVEVTTTSESVQSKFVQMPSLSNIDYSLLYDFTLPSKSNKYGFETLEIDGNTHSFFYNDVDGKPILFSRKFDTIGKRDKRIRQIIAASKKEERFELIEENGSYYFILKARNQAEIARSRTFTSKATAEAAILHVKNTARDFEKEYPQPAKRKKRGNVYNFDVKADTNEKGFQTLRAEDKYHYFIFYGANGQPVLYSQGYSGKGGRDNGIKTVIRNASMTDQHEIKEEDGKYYFVLRAGNRQEIARSAFFASESEAQRQLDSNLISIKTYAEKFGVVIEEAVINTETSNFVINVDLPAVEVKSGLNEDEYLDCEAYKNHEETPVEGFRTFKTDDEYYFAMLDSKGEVLLRSEGYPTTGARDNGLASVQKNRELNERYSFVEDDGEHFVILKAGNHKEIARSCPYKSNAAATAAFGFLSGTGAFPWLALKNRNEDEYLDCDAYKNHDETPAEGFRTFKTDGEYYFAMLDRQGEVLLRSEGYPTVGARDNGLASVQKNREIRERYNTVEENGEHFVVLKAGNHKEIARSCPYENESALLLLFPFLAAGAAGLSFPWEIVGITGATTIAPVTIPEEKVVDLPITKPKPAITPKSDNGGIAGAAGVVGAAAIAAAAMKSDGKAGAVAATNVPKPNPVIATNIAKPTPVAATNVLKPTPVAATTPPVGTATALSDASGAASAGGGIPRWLFALLAAVLLALLLWWLLKGCNPSGEELPIVSGEAAAPIIAVDSVEQDGTAISGEALPEAPAIDQPVELNMDDAEIAASADANTGNSEIIGGVDCGCDTGKEPLFMRYSYEPKTLKKLGSNTEFGNSHALSPSEFYDKLNNAYSNNEVDRVFLDRIFRSMGYANGWSAANASMFSNTTVPYGTVGNIGYGKDHRTQYSTLNLGDYDQKAFLIKSRNGCDVRFMKTCGNHMFYCTK